MLAIPGVGTGFSPSCAGLKPGATSGSASPIQGVTRARYLMGTVCEITADSESHVESAFREAARIESFLSTWRSDSELSRLNAARVATVSAELSSVLERAMDWAKTTGEAFNPLVRPILDAWRTRGEGALPPAAVVDAAVARAKPANVIFEGSTIRLASGAAFEEGAFGKGYAIERMLAQIDAPGTIINFGGQLGVRGSARVTIADPERRSVPVVALTIRDASISTSSGSEKTFVAGGTRFTHLVDPRSGRALPPRGSVSVVARDAFDADVLSTALYVMDVEEGLRWAGAHDVAAIFITPRHEVRLSAAMPRGEIEILDESFKLED
jgi:thiamine biosynthesis lipoprotein